MEDPVGPTDLQDAVQRQARAVADWVVDFAAASYGPHGGHKLLQQDAGPVLLRSGASALREVRMPDPAPGRYKRLATDVQAHVGDQATAAVLLAARLVRGALDSGLPVPILLEGYGLARRQALAVLSSMATAAPAPQVLAHVAPALQAVDPILRGLPTVAVAGGIDLDRIDLRAEPREEPEWSLGSVAEPQNVPVRRQAADAGVILLTDSWHPKPRTEGVTRRIRGVDDLRDAASEEAALRQHFLDHLQDLRAGLLICAKDLDEEVCQEAVRRGVWVWTGAPASAMDRMRQATGAHPIPSLSAATAEDVGRADLEMRPRRRGGLWVRGPGSAATLLLPARPGPWAGAVIDDGERLLRAAGAFLEDPRGVPGGGRWQRSVADALRTAGDAAPGKTPLAVHVAADAFLALAGDLVCNHGDDPLDVPVLPDADTVIDPWSAVRLAVDAAFDTAVRILRVDARYDQPSSSQEGLRGGTGPIGSPKGMPGDVPPLM